MKHRTQLYLDDDQYRWLKRQAKASGSLANVVRELIDSARSERGAPNQNDPFLDYLLNQEPDHGRPGTSVQTLDEDIYSR